MTKTRGRKERMPKKPKVNLSAGAGAGGDGKCMICARSRRGSSKLCRRCLRRSLADITSILARRSSLTYCSGCSSYLEPPRKWVRADRNSTKLLAFCIDLLCKPLPRTVRIVNPQFIESSSHDIIKIKLHLRGEISEGAISERHHVAEFTVCHQICDSCRQSSSEDDPRRGVIRVELRQAHPLRRCALNYLEEAISKNGIADRAVRIQEHDRGTDLLFSNRSDALDLVRFVESAIPVQKRPDDDGISATTTFSLRILPIRRDDLVRLPSAISDSLLGAGGKVGPLVICTGVAPNGIYLMDPFTVQAAFLTAEVYWRAPFRAKIFSYFLIEYLVLDVVMITPDAPDPSNNGAGNNSNCLAHAHIARVSDLGKKDGQDKLMVRTHLGRLLKPGDYVLGYDVGCAAAGSPSAEVILVKKSYGGTTNKNRRKCRGEPSAREPRSTGTGLDGIGNDEYEELLRDLEKNAGLGLIDASPHQMSNECQMLPSSLDYMPSIPAGDEAAADNTTMDWLPITELSSPITSSSEMKRPGGD